LVFRVTWLIVLPNCLSRRPAQRIASRAAMALTWRTAQPGHLRAPYCISLLPILWP